MKKKCGSILSLVLVLVLAFPGTVSFASFNGDSIVIRTDVTCEPDITTTVGNTIASTIFPETEEGSGYVSGMLLALNGFDWTLVSNFDYYIVTSSWISGSGDSQSWYLWITCFNSTDTPFAWSQNWNGSHIAINIGASTGTSYTRYECRYYSGSWNEQWFSTTGAITDQASNGYSFYNSGKYCFDCNFTIVSSHEADEIKNNPNVGTWTWLSSNFESCTDLFAGTQGYNLDGQVVNGSGTGEEEGNNNHMYFQNCEMGFCIPDGMTNFTTFGGAYAYIRYQVDNWVVDHIAEYKIVVSQTVVVGGRQNSGSVTLPLDRDGCIEIPFNSFMTGQNAIQQTGFTTCVTTKLIEQNFYKTYLYSIASSDVNAFVHKQDSSANTNFISELWKLLKNGAISYLIAYNQTDDLTVGLNGVAAQVLPLVFQKYDPYNIRMQVKLIDDQGNESGTVAHLFNLVTGNQDAVDTSGLENQDPYVPDDPDLPTVPDDNSTVPTVVVSGGTWYGQLIGQISNDWQTAEIRQIVSETSVVDSFSANFAPFAENSWVTVMGDYLGALPTPVMTLLIGGTTTLSALALYRWFRRG